VNGSIDLIRWKYDRSFPDQMGDERKKLEERKREVGLDYDEDDRRDKSGASTITNQPDAIRQWTNQIHRNISAVRSSVRTGRLKKRNCNCSN